MITRSTTACNAPAHLCASPLFARHQPAPARGLRCMSALLGLALGFACFAFGGWLLVRYERNQGIVYRGRRRRR